MSHTRGLLGLTVLSAAGYALSFPPFSLSLLAWVALVPFFVACGRTTPQRASLLGLLWGVVAAYGVGWWFPGMLSDYFELPVGVGWLGFFTVAALLAGTYFAALGAWIAWLARRNLAGPLLIAAGWVACEFARARLFGGNPWALSAYSQAESTRLLQVADIAGPYGIGFMLAAVNAAIAGMLESGLRGPRYRLSTAMVCCILAATLFYGEWRVRQPIAAGAPLDVAVVQGAVERGFAWRPEYAQLGLQRYLALTRLAAANRPDLVVWPEYAVSFYLEEQSPERVMLLGRARQLGADLVLGGPRYAGGADGTRYYNSVFLLRDGEIRGRYDKQRLLPIAERSVLGVFGDRRMEYTPGDGPRLLEAASARIGAFLCVEAMFPETVRALANAGAEVLVDLSNDQWFAHEAPAIQHRDAAVLRAIENGRYVVRAATSGISAVIDPRGRTIAESAIGRPEVLRASVRPSNTRTLYQRWGDLAAWLAVGAVALAGLRHTRPTTRTSSERARTDA